MCVCEFVKLHGSYEHNETVKTANILTSEGYRAGWYALLYVCVCNVDNVNADNKHIYATQRNLHQAPVAPRFVSVEPGKKATSGK